jgi:hypothetical protein
MMTVMANARSPRRRKRIPSGVDVGTTCKRRFRTSPSPKVTKKVRMFLRMASEPRGRCRMNTGESRRGQWGELTWNQSTKRERGMSIWILHGISGNGGIPDIVARVPDSTRARAKSLAGELGATNDSPLAIEPSPGNKRRQAQPDRGSSRCRCKPPKWTRIRWDDASIRLT